MFRKITDNALVGGWGWVGGGGCDAGDGLGTAEGVFVVLGCAGFHVRNGVSDVKEGFEVGDDVAIDEGGGLELSPVESLNDGLTVVWRADGVGAVEAGDAMDDTGDTDKLLLGRAQVSPS